MILLFTGTKKPVQVSEAVNEELTDAFSGLNIPELAGFDFEMPQLQQVGNRQTYNPIPYQTQSAACCDKCATNGQRNGFTEGFLIDATTQRVMPNISALFATASNLQSLTNGIGAFGGRAIF